MEPPKFDVQLMSDVLNAAAKNVNSGSGGPFAAAVIDSLHAGKPVCLVANTVFATNDPTAHAEINAIRVACSVLGRPNLAGYTLYSSCYPCPMCYGAIRWAQLDGLVYAATPQQAAAAGFDDRALYEELAKPIHDRSISILRAPMEDVGGASDGPFEAWRSRPEDQRAGGGN